MINLALILPSGKITAARASHRLDYNSGSGFKSGLAPPLHHSIFQSRNEKSLRRNRQRHINISIESEMLLPLLKVLNGFFPEAPFLLN